MNCHHTTGMENEGTHGMDHDSANSYLRRFWIVTFLLIPLVLTNEMATGFLGIAMLPFNTWIGFGIATIIFGFSLVFFQHAWHEIQSRSYGMMTLVSLAVAAGYFFSVASTFIPALHTEFYLEISTLIWVLLFGHYLEARSSASAGNALQEVAKLLPSHAHVLIGDTPTDISSAELKKGDRVLVKPGEKIPADGVVQTGAAAVDESLISGESKPIRKTRGDEVIAGSLCLDGSLTVTLRRVGEHSTVGQIQTLIREAQQTKPRSECIADKAAAVLTLVAGVTALLSLLIWTFVIGETIVFGITLAITVLVIACPHALGLAIPTVTTITTALAVKNGVFIKNLAKLEVIKKADYVVFDKTGTLTEGRFGVTDVKALAGSHEKEVMTIALALDQHSSHVVGRAIVEYAKAKGYHTSPADDFVHTAGKGSSGNINGIWYTVGSRALMEERGALTDEATAAEARMVDGGKTIVFVADEKHVLGLIALADSIRDESYKAIKRLHNLGLRVAMLTGDNAVVGQTVAEELSVDTYFAEVLPEDKYKHVRSLQEGGHSVVMVGDGVNDAPALTQSDVGVAIGAGTDIAVEAGDVVLTRNNPEDVARLIMLARKVYTKMVQNLIWALGYNVVAIPAAAGVFAAWGFFLRPEIGALVMSLSTVIVVANALTLKRVALV